jgi:isopenicillin N synthase-like dioxygenase
MVHEAATGYGFFYLQNHHVDSKFMFDLASQVFSLALDEKMKYDKGSKSYSNSCALVIVSLLSCSSHWTRALGFLTGCWRGCIGLTSRLATRRG